MTKNEIEKNLEMAIKSRKSFNFVKNVSNLVGGMTLGMVNLDDGNLARNEQVWRLAVDGYANLSVDNSNICASKYLVLKGLLAEMEDLMGYLDNDEVLELIRIIDNQESKMAREY